MKYVLCIGLVYGTDHLCNTCSLLDRDKGVCRVLRWNVEKQESYAKEIDKIGTEWQRPNCCPLVQVDSWPDEKEMELVSGGR